MTAIPDFKYSFSGVKVDFKLDPSPPSILEKVEEEHDHDIAAQRKHSGWSKFFSFFLFLSIFSTIILLAVYGLITYILI